jgi:hypothetical protein
MDKTEALDTNIDNLPQQTSRFDKFYALVTWKLQSLIYTVHFSNITVKLFNLRKLNAPDLEKKIYLAPAPAPINIQGKVLKTLKVESCV